MFFKNSDIKVSGINIDVKAIKFVTVARKNGVWHSITNLKLDLPAGLLKPGFNRKNIQDPAEFRAALSSLKKMTRMRSCMVGVSLPCETTKLMIHPFPKLPHGDEQIKEMILWRIGKLTRLDLSDIEIRWDAFPGAGEQSVVLMVGLVSGAVLREYEESLRMAGFTVGSISSADMSLYNFYAPDIPEEGVVAWIGLFPESISIFVLDNGTPLFYKNMKKKLIAQNDADNIDMLIQYFMDEHPDLNIDRYFLSATPSSDLNSAFSCTVFNSEDYHLMYPADRISIHPSDPDTAWSHAAATGAAWSLVDQ
ncbi:hypothetical protein MTBBW1_1430028 [Desulfamplus magnetovallimortis]|uniref:Pilus assembly protein PilM n=1 Tax=Desulfamplus magnetovallimortis TaxID=1246637 RepID=A0A1W1H891_9BACT|nr:hypothetical protein [Desulfamplus magnetovallimortis]SLM28656.1 hypothetical protein MTBBW1_1430028 [Desulfamplus magnetovallimortis]